MLRSVGTARSPPRARTSTNGSKGRCAADYTSGDSTPILPSPFAKFHPTVPSARIAYLRLRRLRWRNQLPRGPHDHKPGCRNVDDHSRRRHFRHPRKRRAHHHRGLHRHSTARGADGNSGRLGWLAELDRRDSCAGVLRDRRSRNHRWLPPPLHTRIVQSESPVAHRISIRRNDRLAGAGHSLGRRSPQAPRVQ